jgi:hypothetical protein
MMTTHRTEGPAGRPVYGGRAAAVAAYLRAAGEWLKGGVRRPRRVTPTQLFLALLAAIAVNGISRFTWYPPARAALLARHGAAAAYDFDELFLLFMFIVMLSPVYLLLRGSLPRWLNLIGVAVVLGAIAILALKQVPALAVLLL